MRRKRYFWKSGPSLSALIFLVSDGTNRNSAAYFLGEGGVPMRTLFALLLLSAAFVSAQDAKIEELGKSPVDFRVLGRNESRAEE